MTLCKYEVFILTDFQTHWLQCVLPLNVYMRKVIVIIYLWLVILIFLVVNDIISYILDLIRGKSIFSKLILDEKTNEYFENEITRKLNPDTFVVIKLIKTNANNFYASAVTSNILLNKTKLL